MDAQEMRRGLFGDAAVLLVGAARVVGEPVDLCCAAGGRALFLFGFMISLIRSARQSACRRGRDATLHYNLFEHSTCSRRC